MWTAWSRSGFSAARKVPPLFRAVASKWNHPCGGPVRIILALPAPFLILSV
jgi:hypothetical protein